jgi:hypothetical protein
MKLDVLIPRCARLGLAFAVAWLLWTPLAQATTYNLAADWSTSSNPNGAWSYNQGAAPLPLFQNNWLATGLNAWTTAAGQPPSWSRATIAFGTAVAGDVIVHASNSSDPLANVTWTSPAAGVIDVSGQAWDVQHATGRDDDWSLMLNATVLASRASILNVAKDSSDADFANNIVLGQTLNGLAVQPGDVVTFQVRRIASNFGHFTGVELNIELVPEPSAIGLSAIGALAVLATAIVCRRRGRCR